MADFNLDKLTQDQLMTLRQGVVSGLSKEQIGAMVDIFGERNDAKAMTDPANAPGPPRFAAPLPLGDEAKYGPGVVGVRSAIAPLPAVLDPRTAHLNPSAERNAGSLEDRDRATNQLAQSVAQTQDSRQTALSPGYWSKTQPAPGGFNIPDLAQLVPGLTTGGKILPASLSALASATTKTPGDLATLAATSGAGQALQGWKLASQPANSLLRAAQGAGLYAGGKAMSDVTNGRDVNFGPTDLLFGGLSAGLGSVQGASEVPSAKTQEMMKLQTAMQAYEEHQKKIAAVKTALEKADEEVFAAKNAHADAETSLKGFEQKTDILKKLKDPNYLSRLRAQQMFGKGTDEQAQIEQHSSLKDSAEKALEAKRTEESLRLQLQTKMAKMNEKAPKKPSSEDESSLGKLLLKATKRTLPGAVGGEFGSLLHVSPVLGVAAGLAMDQLANSQAAGQKLLQFFGKSVGPSATQLVPSLVNQRAQEK